MNDYTHVYYNVEKNIFYCIKVHDNEITSFISIDLFPCENVEMCIPIKLYPIFLKMLLLSILERILSYVSNTVFLK